MRLEKITAILILISAILAVPSMAANVTKVEIYGTLFDQFGAKTLSWDAMNFAGFWHVLATNKSSEKLWIEQDASNLTSSSREVKPEKLFYKTSRTEQKYKTFAEKGKLVERGLDYNSGTKTFTNGATGGYYARLGWFGDLYVAVNGKANKLAKMVKEQKAEEKQNLKIGETWSLGEGYNLTVQALDTQVSPRQAWLSLAKDGKMLDNKVANEGDVYTYVEKNIANESDVPVFVTFAESIFSGTSGDIVQLRYTWIISQNVTEIKAGDKFGVFGVREANEDFLLLYNKDKSISLDQNTVQPLYRDLKFRVGDSATALRFYPIREYNIQEPSPPATITQPDNATITPIATATKTPNSTAIAAPDVARPTVTPVQTTKMSGNVAAILIALLICVAYFVLRKSYD